jgi:hypothetical protein
MAATVLEAASVGRRVAVPARTQAEQPAATWAVLQVPERVAMLV